MKPQQDLTEHPTHCCVPIGIQFYLTELTAIESLINSYSKQHVDNFTQSHIQQNRLYRHTYKFIIVYDWLHFMQSCCQWMTERKTDLRVVHWRSSSSWCKFTFCKKKRINVLNVNQINHRAVMKIIRAIFERLANVPINSQWINVFSIQPSVLLPFNFNAPECTFPFPSP